MATAEPRAASPEGDTDDAPGPLVAARGLRYAFAGSADVVVRMDELAVYPGEHTAFVGPSGCGKTTLLRLLTGIITPTGPHDAGEVELAGRRLATLGEAGRRALRIRRVGMVFQRFALLDYLTALENILLPFRINKALGREPGGDAPRGGSWRAARSAARELAEATGIAHALARKPHQLSQGERQRVAICRALVAGPSLIVADEPTGNLDPARAASVVDLILDRAAATGATVLLVTHDHAQLGRFGRVVDMGAAAGQAAAGRGGGAGAC